MIRAKFSRQSVVMLLVAYFALVVLGTEALEAQLQLQGWLGGILAMVGLLLIIPAQIAYSLYDNLKIKRLAKLFTRYQLLGTLKEINSALEIWGWAGISLVTLSLGLAYLEIPAVSAFLTLYGIITATAAGYIFTRLRGNYAKLKAITPADRKTFSWLRLFYFAYLPDYVAGVTARYNNDHLKKDG